MRPIPFVALALLLLSGCESDPLQGELPACVCDNGGCSQTSCPIEILLDQTCVGEVTTAEALIGVHVETTLIAPTAPFTACTRIEPGQSVDVTVRGGPWVWGPLNERCDTPGETRSLVLQCVEAAN